MKNRKQRLLTIILGGIFVLTAVSIIPEYMAQHDYYMGNAAQNIVGMLIARKHRGMLISGMLVASFGVRRFGKTKTRRQKILVIISIVIWYAIIHLGFKGGLTGAGFFGLVWKHLWIVAIIVFHIASVHAVGSFIGNKLFSITRSVSHVILQMAMGLVANILVMYILLLVGAMYTPVVWLIYALMGGLIYVQRKEITQDYQTLHHARTTAIDRDSRLRWVQQALLVGAIVYMLYGIQLAFIPYSTARDANHAYMFFPKIRADHHGLYRSDGPRTAPFVRYSYIAQWFSSMERLTPITGIARDTMAVMMNFVTSGLGLLVVGTALLDTVSKWLTTDHNSATAFSLMSGSMLLLWLTSGMGAFLVFVDNKTDLGILLLVMVAMMSAFLFLRHMDDEKTEQTMSPSRYAMMSGFFFGIAFLGKPTAFLDVAGFITMVLGTQLGVLGVLGIFALIIGLMAMIQMRSTGTYLEPSAGKIALGGILLVPAFRLAKAKKSRQWLRLMVLWGLVLVATIVIGKMPYLLHRADDRGVKDRMNNMLMGYQKPEKIETKTLLASTGDQNNPNDKVLVQTGQNIETPSLVQCSLSTIGATMDDLRSRQKPIIGGGGSEDNGRYVGYGQRVLTAEKSGVRYHLTKGIFRSNNGCYTFNDLARTLCQSQDQLHTGSVSTFVAKIAPAYEYANDIHTKLTKKHIFPQDAVKLLNEYRKSRTISTTTQSVGIPYRWLVPQNITFNRSLQNRSSYYTDIGFVRLPLLLIVVVGFVRGILIRDRKIIALTGATILVRCSWILVADGIVRYGMGMILWTMIASTAVLVRWYERTNSKQVSTIIARTGLACLASFFAYQRLMNMMRISSQGAGGPFLSYKQGFGETQQVALDEKGALTAKSSLKTITQNDILSLQFPHYLPIIAKLENRKDDDGVFIAGTYLQYFLRNQSNIRSDNLVTSLRKEMSDSDVCATYLRLRDTGYRTIILDPNIATVVMGAGNESLKERFIMKEDAQGKRIEDGTISMMTRLVMADYAKLGFTNNVGIYYAYALPSETLKSLMKKIGETDEVTFRTRLAMLRFLPGKMSSSYYGIVGQLFFQRFGTYEGMQDVGRIFGAELDQNARKVVNTALRGKVDQAAFDALTTNQRSIAYRYASLISMAQNPRAQSQLQEQLKSIMMRSISSQSQIVSFVLQ